jgi:uncharacterized protein (TIRG00374 family)
MRKWLVRIVRGVLAAGIAALGLWLSGITLKDQVRVPPTAEAFADLGLEKPTEFDVVDGDLEAVTGPITLRIGPEAQTRVIDAADLGVGSDDFQPRPGLWRIFARCRPGLLLAGLLILLPVYPIAALRWWLLMRSRGLDVSAWRTFKVSMVGNFFNFCLPGTTGGDLAKAYYAVRQGKRRADALVSILVDRVAGLVGMVVLAAGVGLFMLHEPLVRSLTLKIGLGAAALAVGAFFYFNQTLRRRSGFDWLIQRLPGGRVIAKIDEAAVAYRHHKPALVAAIAMSVCIHLLVATATAASGYALGLSVSFGVLLNVVPILFMAAALPLAYQGMGLREPLAMLILKPTALSGAVSGTANHIVGMLLLITIFQIFYSLCGAVFLLKGDVQMQGEG